MDKLRRPPRASGRYVIVVDDEAPRRDQLIDRLVAAGLTPLAPKTPLDSFELLSRTEPEHPVLVAPSFSEAVADTYPGFDTHDITDDVDDTVSRAIASITPQSA
ncbi:MAG: hypothetical protein AB7L94_07710 [Kofleriaceae bacterium]